MDQVTKMETRLAEPAPQESTLAQSGSNVLRRHIKENPKKAALARHRLWLDSIPYEYPMPYTPYKIGVYIRYFNQTRHENYLEKHIQQYMDDIALCPQWTLVDFYVDRGMTAPHMTNMDRLFWTERSVWQRQHGREKTTPSLATS